MFAVIGTGQNLAEDNQGGFFNRLQLTPVHPAALVAGQLAGTLTLGLFQAATYISVGLLAGAHIEAGLGGALVLILLAIAISSPSARSASRWACGSTPRRRSRASSR